MALGYAIIPATNTLDGNRAGFPIRAIITLSQTYSTMFTRCIAAAGVIQNMLRAIQCKHPSDSEYKILKLIDTTKVQCRHYAVAVDINDRRTYDLFMTFLNVLCGQDLVSLIAFGLHSARYAFKKQDYLDNENIRNAVQKTLTRSEVGLNTLVGVRMLEKCNADIYIMISDFHRDRAPPLDTQLNITYLTFSHACSISRRLCFIKNGPHERIIRDTFGIPNPVYFNMTCDSTILIHSPPIGGSCMVKLPPGVIMGLTVNYMLSDGTEVYAECELQDDETIPYESPYMRQCRRVE